MNEQQTIYKATDCVAFLKVAIDGALPFVLMTIVWAGIIAVNSGCCGDCF